MEPVRRGMGFARQDWKSESSAHSELASIRYRQTRDHDLQRRGSGGERSPSGDPKILGGDAGAGRPAGLSSAALLRLDVVNEGVDVAVAEILPEGGPFVPNLILGL